MDEQARLENWLCRSWGDQVPDLQQRRHLLWMADTPESDSPGRIPETRKAHQLGGRRSGEPQNKTLLKTLRIPRIAQAIHHKQEQKPIEQERMNSEDDGINYQFGSSARKIPGHGEESAQNQRGESSVEKRRFLQLQVCVGTRINIGRKTSITSKL